LTAPLRRHLVFLVKKRYFMSSRPIRFAATLAAAALAGSVLALTAPAAHAAPVFVDANTDLDGFAGASTSSGACVTTPTTANTTAVPIVENGPAVTVSPSVTANSANGGDTAVLAATSTATGSVKSAGGNPSALDFTTSGTASADFALPASGCTLTAYSGSDLDFTFVVTTPGFLHLDFKSKGSFYSEVYIYDTPAPTNYPYYDHYGRGLDFAGKDTVYLPAGSYSGYFEGYAQVTSNVDKVVTGTTSVHATFSAAGATTAAPTGKAAKYVSLGSRSCATHSLSPTVTNAKKAAKKIKMVKIFVNDQLAKKVKKPKKGAVISVPLTDSTAADVTAEVTLFPKKKGAKSKVSEVSASYEACTS
jgi:hypothetical protein